MEAAADQHDVAPAALGEPEQRIVEQALGDRGHRDHQILVEAVHRLSRQAGVATQPNRRRLVERGEEDIAQRARGGRQLELPAGHHVHEITLIGVVAGPDGPGQALSVCLLIQGFAPVPVFTGLLARHGACQGRQPGT